MKDASQNQRLTGLDDLRGWAALAVCIFHLEDGPGLLRWPARNGFLGVYVFFVISGFILPLTMHRQGYRLRNFGVFMAKRLVRLYPPFIISLGMIVVLGLISSRLLGYQNAMFPVEWPRMWSNLSYTAGIFGLAWYNWVYWTLAIEFQFYLIIALALPFLAGSRNLARWGVWALLALAPLVGGGPAWVTTYLPFFLLGIWAFWQREGFLSSRISWLLFVITFALCWKPLGAKGAIAAGATALAIVFVKTSWRPLRFLGTISYSVYLTHIPLFYYLARLRTTEFPALNELLFHGLALATAVPVGWIFYTLVEAPSMRLASSIRYSPRLTLRAAGKLHQTEVTL